MNNRRGQRKNNRPIENNVTENGVYTDHNEPSELRICSRCGKPIKDLSVALADKTDGNPVHFDCVLHLLQENEILHENEALSYIGQGKFAVIKYASMVTMKEFTIVRVIEWEDKNTRADWRGKIADRFSHID